MTQACVHLLAESWLLIPGAFSSDAGFGDLPWTLATRQRWPVQLSNIVTWSTLAGLLASARNADAMRREPPKRRAILLLSWLLACLVQIVVSVVPAPASARLIVVTSAALIPLGVYVRFTAGSAMSMQLQGVAGILAWAVPWSMHALTVSLSNPGAAAMGTSGLLRFVLLVQLVWQVLAWANLRLAASTHAWGLLEVALAMSHIVTIRATLLAKDLGSAHACIAVYFFLAVSAVVMNQRVSVPGLVEERLVSVWYALAPACAQLPSTPDTPRMLAALGW